jgi:hypothetical protein
VLAQRSRMHYPDIKAIVIGRVAFHGRNRMSQSEQRATPKTSSKQKDNQATRQGEHQPTQQHDEDALDEALDESFPASDPVAVHISTGHPDKAKRGTSS